MTTDTRHQIYFLDTLRGVAAWLVVWDHLACAYPERHGVVLPFVRVVNELINQPLGLIQNFGWFGVCLFFLISGFVITHVSLREQPAEFAIKRVFRIFPMLALAVAMVLLLDSDARAQATAGAVLSNVLLLNYWQHPQVVLVGVAWTLAIEILFYAWTLLTYPLLRWPGQRAGLLLAAVACVIMIARAFGDSFFLFAASVAYLPYLAVGQILYCWVYQRAFGMATGLVLLAGSYGVLLMGLRSIHVQFLPADNSYLSSFIAALAVFMSAWHLGDRLKPGRVMRVLAETSYSVYLFHGILGFYLLDRLIPLLGLMTALVVTVPAVMAFVFVLHRTVERPLLAHGRRLAARVVGSRQANWRDTEERKKRDNAAPCSPEPLK